MSEIQQKVMALMENEFGLYDLQSDTPIFSAKRLDSMDVLRLIVALEKEFSISVPPFDVSLDTFDTVDSVVELVNSKIA